MGKYYGKVTNFIIKFVEEKCPLQGHKQYWERMISCFLNSKDGVYQTSFVIQCNMSKSLVSQVLSVMKERKIIQRVKKGKENFIRPVNDLKDFLSSRSDLPAITPVFYQREQDLDCIADEKGIKGIEGERIMKDKIVINEIDTMGNQEKDIRKEETAVPDNSRMPDGIHATIVPKPEGIVYTTDQNAAAVSLLLQTLARFYDLEKRTNEVNAVNIKLQQESRSIAAGANEQKRAFQLLKKQLEEALGAIVQLGAEKDELSIKLSTLPQENSALADELNGVRQEKDAILKSVEEKDKVLVVLDKKMEGLIKENQELNVMNNTSSNQLLNKEGEIKKLQERINELEAKLNEQNGIISEANAIKDKLKYAEEQLAKAQNAKKELEDQVSLMQEEINRLSKAMDEKSSISRKIKTGNPKDSSQGKPVDAKQQVLDLLAGKADGIMKQADMIEELDYSRSFLSQVFISLKDESKISISSDPDDKRGNIIKLLKQNSDEIDDSKEQEQGGKINNLPEINDQEFELNEVQKKFLILFVKNPQGLSLDKIQKSTGYDKETIEDVLPLFKEMGLIEIKKHNRKGFVAVNSQKIKEVFPKLIQEEAEKEFKKKLDEAMIEVRQLLRKNNSILLSSLHGLSSIGKEYSEKLLEAIKYEFSQEYSIAVSDQQDFTKCRIDFVSKQVEIKPEPLVKSEKNGKGDEMRSALLSPGLAAIASGSEKRLEQAVTDLMVENCSASAEIIADKLSEKGITANSADIHRVIKNINNNNGGQAIGERQIGEEVIYNLVC